MLDFVGQAKWDAWNALGNVDKTEAQRRYVDVINGVGGTSVPSAASLCISNMICRLFCIRSSK